MPVIKETDDPVDSTKRVLKFATTPIMNTYALAFIIGQYEYIEEQANGVVVRMYTAPGKSKLVLSALKTAIRFLNFFVSYPLPKLDLVAFTDILGNKIVGSFFSALTKLISFKNDLTDFESIHRKPGGSSLVMISRS